MLTWKSVPEHFPRRGTLRYDTEPILVFLLFFFEWNIRSRERKVKRKQKNSLRNVHLCGKIPAVNLHPNFLFWFALVASSTPQQQSEDPSYIYMVDMSSNLSMKPDISANSISPFSSNALETSESALGRPLNPTPQKATHMVSFSRGAVPIAESRLDPIDELKSSYAPEDDCIDGVDGHTGLFWSYFWLFFFSGISLKRTWCNLDRLRMLIECTNRMLFTT